MYAVEPLKYCEHLEQVAPVPGEGLDVKASCVDCGNVGENWVCLVCYKVLILLEMLVRQYFWSMHSVKERS